MRDIAHRCERVLDGIDEAGPLSDSSHGARATCVKFVNGAILVASAVPDDGPWCCRWSFYTNANIDVAAEAEAMARFGENVARSHLHADLRAVIISLAEDAVQSR